MPAAGAHEEAPYSGAWVPMLPALLSILSRAGIGGGHVLVVSFLIAIGAMAASSRKKLGVIIFLFSGRMRHPY